MSRIELPEAIRNKMAGWRNGFNGFPDEYIAFHENLAKKALEDLKSRGVVVRSEYLSSDGWMDGMRALTATIEHNGEVKKIQWHDGNQEFFVQVPSGGSIQFKI